jgi:hypothetical protein
VCLDPVAVEEDIRREDLAAQQVVDDERRDVALAAARVLGRPLVIRVRSVKAPSVPDRLFQFGEREGRGSRDVFLGDS